MKDGQIWYDHGSVQHYTLAQVAVVVVGDGGGGDSEAVRVGRKDMMKGRVTRLELEEMERGGSCHWWVR